MAQDWIKMRTDLHKDPKVIAMANAMMSRLCRATERDMSRDTSATCRANVAPMSRDDRATRTLIRHTIAGALLGIWGAVRAHGARDKCDAVVENASLDYVDDVTDLEGFGQAMADVGWVIEREGCLVFPRFFEDMNAAVKDIERSQNTERQRRRRANSVAPPVAPLSRDKARHVAPEKSREEKNNNSMETVSVCVVLGDEGAHVAPENDTHARSSSEEHSKSGEEFPTTVDGRTTRVRWPEILSRDLIVPYRRWARVRIGKHGALQPDVHELNLMELIRIPEAERAASLEAATLGEWKQVGRLTPRSGPGGGATREAKPLGTHFQNLSWVKELDRATEAEDSRRKREAVNT